MKKIFYLVFFISLCFLVNVNIAEASNQCKYFSANSKIQKNYSFDGECPVVVGKDGKKVDLSSTGIYKTDDFYILDGYEIIDGKSNVEYSGQIYFAQAIYYEEKTILLHSRYFYVTYNDGNFSVKMSPMGSNSFTNHIAQQNFFTADNKKFVPHNQIYYSTLLDSYATKETINLYVLKKDIQNTGLATIREVNLKSSVIIYENGASSTNSVLDVKNYCGAYNGAATFTATLYSNNVVKFSGVGNPPEIKLSENEKITSLPNEVCVTYYKEGNTEFSSIYLGSCKTEASMTYTTSCDIDSSEDIQEETDFLDGTEYLNLLGALKSPLGFLSAEALDIPLTINGNESATLNNNVTANYNLCSGTICSDNALYLTTQGIRNVRQYCNILYERYPDYQVEKTNLDKRMKECSSFDSFYKELVSRGIIADLSKGCDILSDDLKDKLVWVLDIIKIAGPILALGLGTLDFIKVLANGDADKEMKTAFKRFMTRLGAAALLFIIPLILAFLLDMFLGNQDGYDSNNPFCIKIDWDE